MPSGLILGKIQAVRKLPEKKFPPNVATYFKPLWGSNKNFISLFLSKPQTLDNTLSDKNQS